MSKSVAEGPFTVAIEDGSIVLRLPLGTIACAVEGADSYQVECPLRVTDPVKFAPYVVRALQREDHDGARPTDTLFDKAFWDAAEDAAEGVEIGTRDRDTWEVTWPSEAKRSPRKLRKR